MARPWEAMALACWLAWAGCAEPAGAPGSPSAAAANAEALRAARATRPEDARGAWVRITPAGLAALPGIAMSTLAPGRIAADGSQRVPIGTIRRGDLVVCPRGDCALRLGVEGLQVRAEGTGAVVLEARARASTGAIAVRYDQTWPCAFSGRPECSVDVDTGRAGPPSVMARATLRFVVDAETGLTRIELAGVDVPQGVDDADVSIAGTNVCGAIWCSAANVVGASGILAGQVNEALAGALREQAERIPSPIAGLWVLEPEDRTSEVALAFAFGDENHVGREGIDLAARLSATPSRRHRCVPAVPAPPPRPLPRDVVGNAAPGPLPRATVPGRGEAHARVALGEAALARAGWALHQAGVLCVEAGGQDIPALTPAALGALLPAARHLAPLGVTSPSIAVRPLQPPEIRIADDGSLAIEITRAQIELWATVDRRPLRLAFGQIDAGAIARITTGRDGLALEIPRDRITVRVRDTWSAPVLGAQPAELRSLFEALARVALDQVPERITLGETAPAATPRAPTRAPSATLSRLRLASPPRRVRAGNTSALVLDLRFEAPSP